MAYRVYIKHDYKPRVVGTRPQSWRLRDGSWTLLISCLLLSAVTGFLFLDHNEPENTGLQTDIADFTITVTPDALKETATQEQPALKVREDIRGRLSGVSPQSHSEKATEIGWDWTDIKIKPGDSTERIFIREGLSRGDLQDILDSHEQATALNDLQPNKIISLHVEDGELKALKFDLSLTQTLLATKQVDEFTSEIITTELEIQPKKAQGVIKDNLFLTGKDAGLSDRLIMQLIYIYGWDIDFNLDIRKGDSFKVIYEEKFKSNEKVAEGDVLAAEFNNRGRVMRSVRFVRADGQADYFADNGSSMRKTFTRNPLAIGRISSHFNLKRKHPVLNRIRAHKGVDYAAATGTEIKVTGDGKVQFIGNKGGYGKTVIVKHGEKYTTLYAHMSRFKKGLKRGQRVKQGQVIGYVGRSGLATGPHLHYEFRMDGTHRNPVTVPLPQADSISAAEAEEFRIRSSYLLALLDTPDATLLAQYDTQNSQ